MRPQSLAACLALALALPFGAAAQAGPQPEPAAKPAATGNAETGRVLAYTCQGCHGITGYKNSYPQYHVPRIAGQSEQYLKNALTAYREGKRKHPTMHAQSMSFSEAEITAIATYLSSLKKK